ncbi:hypothetical protein KKG83_04420 [Candidatus Micrarchaeota archaeon]|nr:hypothetical protein [Candidatus Micrarchaeota archaeon]
MFEADYTLRIDDSGIIIEETYPSLEEGGPEGQTKVGKISRKELEELAKFIINKNFFSLEDNYICDPLECGTDRQYTSITVTIGCQTKSITLYTEAERPKEIGEIINKILSYNGQLSCTLSAPKYR